MGRHSCAKLKFLIAAVIITLPACAYAAEQSEVDRLIRGMTPPAAIAKDIIKEKDEWLVSSFYEPSDIIQGNRTGHWNELTNNFMYTHRNIRSYISMSQFERFDDNDRTFNFGSYLSFKDSYVHAEVGFGGNVDYMYKLISITEYGHKLYDMLYWQIGYTYRAYGTDDTHLVAPMLIYYFGNSYMSANYGATFMEAHDTASWGSVRGDFEITDFLHWYGGVAFGERLYDIYGLDAHEERGYILFTGLSLTPFKWVNLRAGYSYGTEKPKFIKRSLNFYASVRF